MTSWWVCLRTAKIGLLAALLLSGGETFQPCQMTDSEKRDLDGLRVFMIKTESHVRIPL